MSAVAESRYLPHLMRIGDIRLETRDVRTLRLDFLDEGVASTFSWRAGQFALFSAFGSGESVFTIANPPTRGGRIECTFRITGNVTSAFDRLSQGQVIGFRGPYGNSFDVEEWKGHDLVFVGGGIGMAAVAAPLRYALDNRADYGEVVILNGARTVSDMVFKDEMGDWEQLDRVKVVRTVDPGGEEPGYTGRVGLIPSVFEELGLAPAGRIVVICGPPVMLHFMLLTLDKLGYAGEQIVTTLENRMKCGFGQCGHCNVGRFVVCRDGPVVTAAQLRDLPKDM